MTDIEIKYEEQPFDEMEATANGGDTDTDTSYEGGGGRAYCDDSPEAHNFSMQDPFGMNSDLDYQDMGLYSLLLGWKLSHLYRELFAQKITLDVLKIMKSKHVDNLFRHVPLGDQISFEYHFEKWRNAMGIPIDTTTVAVLATTPVKQTTPTNALTKDINSSNKNHDNHSGTPTLSSRFEAASVKSDGSNAVVATPLRNDGGSTKHVLANILNSTSNGKMIKKYYAKHNALHEEQRNALINTIARFIEAEGCGLTLAESAQIERQIIETFPNEKLEFYTTGKRGRIYNKVANLKRCSKSLTIAEQTSTPVPKNIYVPEADATYYAAKLRTANNFDEFEDCWKRCSQYRFSQIEAAKTTEEIVSKWPDYRLNFTLQLINIDFALKYNTATTLSSLWPESVDKLVAMLKHKVLNNVTSMLLQELTNCNEASRDLTILWALHHLFPPTPISITSKDGAKIKKRFTISDSQDAFLVLANTDDEMSKKLQMLKMRGRSNPPCLVALGLLNDIREIWVYFDGHRLAVPQQSTLLAADLCLKLFLTLNIEYTEEASIFYNFIQSYFYGIPTLKKNTRISTIINELNS